MCQSDRYSSEAEDASSSRVTIRPESLFMFLSQEDIVGSISSRSRANGGGEINLATVVCSSYGPSSGKIPHHMEESGWTFHSQSTNDLGGIHVNNVVRGSLGRPTHHAALKFRLAVLTIPPMVMSFKFSKSEFLATLLTRGSKRLLSASICYIENICNR